MDCVPFKPNCLVFKTRGFYSLLLFILFEIKQNEQVRCVFFKIWMMVTSYINKTAM